MDRVAAFTDTYLPTVNGVTYTVSTWRDRWRDRGGRMPVVYPSARDYTPRDGELPVWSLPFPFYDGYRLGLPRVPSAIGTVDVVHAHTPFTLGMAATRLARRRELPLVASYHTPTGEYTDYLAPTAGLARRLRRLSEAWERRFLGRATVVLTPSEATRDRLRKVDLAGRVDVLPNGVDIDRFRPVHPGAFLRRHDLEDDRTLVGYTGRHGHEKRLHELIDAAAALEVTVVFGGDGPARTGLEQHARERGVDARFLGFLDREELPTFYSALDLFAFPSPVETQGIVALEAMACGTPVVGADRAALSETIDSGTTGYHYESGDVESFRRAIRRGLEDQSRLRAACLDRRPSMSVEHTIDRLEALYASL